MLSDSYLFEVPTILFAILRIGNPSEVLQIMYHFTNITEMVKFDSLMFHEIREFPYWKNNFPFMSITPDVLKYNYFHIIFQF